MRLNEYAIMSALIIITGVNTYGQNEKKNYFGGHISFGALGFSHSDGSFWDLNTGKNYLTLGFDYSRMNSEYIELGIGLSVTGYNMESFSTYNWNQTSNSDDYFLMFSFPARLKVHFLKYLFTEGMVCFNFHPNEGHTWWGIIGAGIGIGAEYMFESGVVISMTPRIQWNIKGTGGVGSNDHENLIQKGIRVGIGYRF
ncbi:MAG: hypothetical protein LBQ60_12955 [Bacteroidales bacterium]|nr:hypothetical protein [Bacteroidales bacterium]